MNYLPLDISYKGGGDSLTDFQHKIYNWSISGYGSARKLKIGTGHHYNLFYAQGGLELDWRSLTSILTSKTSKNAFFITFDG